MQKNISIQLKAAFLLIVFSLNTIVGFACSIGMDMGFNTGHHDGGKATETSVHIHADGKKHVHHKKVSEHQHNALPNEDHKSTDKKDNCCNDSVIKITQLDKAVPQAVTITHPAFFAVFVSSFYHVDFSFSSQVVKNIKHFLRSYHPPISDIRITIQSFQI